MNVLGPSLAIVGWLSSIMHAEAPPARWMAQDDPKKSEAVASETARYESFATDVARVVYDPEEQPVFDGPNGRAKTAMLLMSVALYESGFRRDVDMGIGTHSRGDHGRSCTAWQFNLGSGKTQDGYTCKDMYADRTLAVRAAMRIMRDAMKTCRGTTADRMSYYTAGHCIQGEVQATRRVQTAQRWMVKYPAPQTDEQALEEQSHESRRTASE